MYISIIFVVSLFSVIDLKSADSAVVHRCYKLIYSVWDSPIWDRAVTNIWCENKCTAKSSNYQYSGTIFRRCFCRYTTLDDYDSDWLYECTTTFNCAAQSSEICGGHNNGVERITVSKLDQTTESVAIPNTQASIATSVSMRESTTAEFISIMTSDTTPAKVTQSALYTTRELSSTTSENANPALSTVKTETSTQAITAETVTVTNTQATSATFVSIKASTTADFMNTITTDTSPAIVTQSTPSTIPELFRTTSKHTNTTISTLITETLAHATIGIRPRKLQCKCPKRLINTKWHFLDGKNITDAEVKKMVLEDFNKNIKSQISVDKKTVSKEVRKKISSVNNRKSSQSIGWGCIVFLILPMVILISIDILNCCSHFRTRLGGRKRDRIRPITNIQDKSDSSKPLQENVNITESYYASRCGNNFHPDEMKRETYQRRRDDNYQQRRDKWLQYI